MKRKNRSIANRHMMPTKVGLVKLKKPSGILSWMLLIDLGLKIFATIH